MALTPPPTAPSPGQDAATFNENVEARLAWDAVNVAELNALQADVTVKQAATNEDAAAAAISRSTAEAAAAAAIAVAGAVQWVSGTNYALGVAVWSPSDFQTYRHTVAGVSNTDPANDPATWEAVGASGSGINEANTETLAANKVLTADSPGMQVLTAPGYGYYVQLPSATTLDQGGPHFDIIVAGSYPIGVLNGAGQVVGQILPNDRVKFSLSNITTAAGAWQTEGNLDPWFQTAEAGFKAWNGATLVNVSDNISLLFYQNEASLPCVRYVSHPAGVALTVGNEYVLDAVTASSVQTTYCVKLGANRMFVPTTGSYGVVVDWSAGAALAVGARTQIYNGSALTSWGGHLVVQDDRYVVALGYNAAAQMVQAICFDCGANGTTITAGAMVQTSSYTGTSSYGYDLAVAVNSTVAAVKGRYNNGSYWRSIARCVVRAGTTLTWGGDAGDPTGLITTNSAHLPDCFSLGKDTSNAECYLIPYYQDANAIKFGLLKFPASGGTPTWAAIATSTLASTTMLGVFFRVSSNSIVQAGYQTANTAKIELITANKETNAITFSLSGNIDSTLPGASRVFTLQNVSDLDGKGLVYYLDAASGSKTHYKGFAVSGSTVSIGSNRFEPSASGQYPLNGQTFSFSNSTGASSVTYQRIGVAQSNASNDVSVDLTKISIDASGNLTFGPFSKGTFGASGGAIGLSNGRVAISTNMGLKRWHGVMRGDGFKFAEGSFGSPQSGSIVQGNAEMIGLVNHDVQIGKNATLYRFKFAEV
ncbi:hypothetical protein [Noviherbaspirillum saxi]|uniref:Uncharacterized protein n=1 Tax=Noviherbaspirillum saxi TaxID=2320863 RepID=A0A3A3GDN2_9BURK|nr:hypothetical protein [Noviherbaspirillum saxi]RJF99009.1 hypothetical protein D3871_11190 [Noviherbaspirillum saxi]